MQFMGAHVTRVAMEFCKLYVVSLILTVSTNFYEYSYSIMGYDGLVDLFCLINRAESFEYSIAHQFKEMLCYGNITVNNGAVAQLVEQ